MCFGRPAEKEYRMSCDGAHDPTEKCEPEPPRFAHWAPLCDPCLVRASTMRPVSNGRTWSLGRFYGTEWVKEIRPITEAAP